MQLSVRFFAPASPYTFTILLLHLRGSDFFPPLRHNLACEAHSPLRQLHSPGRLGRQVARPAQPDGGPGDLADLAEPPGPDDLVIVEADRSVEALALLRRHPIWRLLSVDTVTGALTAFSSRSYSAQSVEDVLVHVLEDQA